MNEIVKLMLDYSIRHEIEEGISIEIHDDGSGSVYPFMGNQKDTIFCFQNEADFLQKIKE